MKKSVYIIGLGIALSLLGPGCEPDYCLRGSGDMKIVEVFTDDYDTLVINGILTVILIEDSLDYVAFEGGENKLEMVSAVRMHSRLQLNNTNNCFVRPEKERVTARVHFTDLNSLLIGETCYVKTEKPLTTLKSIDFRAKMAELDIALDRPAFILYSNKASGGNLKLSGFVDRCTFIIYYTMNTDFTELDTRTLSIYHHAITDFYVNAAEQLQVSIYNKGNVYYSGFPEIIVDTLAGTGRVLPWTIP